MTATPQPVRGRVLMIAYAFPPAGGSGVQRTAKFAKYLPAFGWQPTVWSTTAPFDLPRDTSLLADLPADLDHRVHDRYDTARWSDAAARATRRVGKAVLRSDVAADGVAWRAKRLVQWCVLHGLAPDASVLWALSSARQLRRLAKTLNIDVIYSTYSPASNHLLAWLVSRATGKPWVADFRDIWTQDFRYPFTSGPWWRRTLDRALERRFLHSASAVIGVTAPQTELLASLVPGQRGKFITIPNGVDLADFPAAAGPEVGSELGALPRRDFFRLAYVGRFCAGTITPAFFEALNKLRAQLGGYTPRFELRLVGHISTELRERMRRWEGRWSLTGYLPHAEAIREMREADALLLGVAEGPHAETVMTGKVYEYMAAGRPILVMGPENLAASRLVTECRAGVVSPADPDALADAMVRLWRQWIEGTLPPGCSRARIGPYTRHHLTGRLAAVFEAMCDGGSVVRAGSSQRAGLAIEEGTDTAVDEAAHAI